MTPPRKEEREEMVSEPFPDLGTAPARKKKESWGCGKPSRRIPCPSTTAPVPKDPEVDDQGVEEEKEEKEVTKGPEEEMETEASPKEPADVAAREQRPETFSRPASSKMDSARKEETGEFSEGGDPDPSLLDEDDEDGEGVNDYMDVDQPRDNSDLIINVSEEEKKSLEGEPPAGPSRKVSTGCVTGGTNILTPPPSGSTVDPGNKFFSPLGKRAHSVVKSKVMGQGVNVSSKKTHYSTGFGPSETSVRETFWMEIEETEPCPTKKENSVRITDCLPTSNLHGHDDIYYEMFTTPLKSTASVGLGTSEKVNLHTYSRFATKSPKSRFLFIDSNGFSETHNRLTIGTMSFKNGKCLCPKAHSFGTEQGLTILIGDE
ncbi:MAG: hypothetical protein AAGJ80_13225, partial [Cyanobacteria bacterium J06553_1]